MFLERSNALETILHYILLPWWFSLPGYVANVCPGFARKLPGGTKTVSMKYLGPNKTWMALPAAIAGAMLVAYLQSQLNHPAGYPDVTWLTLGLCFGIGAPVGDWIKSFFKRLLGISPGGKWWVEKFDFLIASFIILAIVGVQLPLIYYLTPLAFYLMVHGPGNRLSYKLGWRNSPH